MRKLHQLNSVSLDLGFSKVPCVIHSTAFVKMAQSRWRMNAQKADVLGHAKCEENEAPARLQSIYLCVEIREWTSVLSVSDTSIHFNCTTRTFLADGCSCCPSSCLKWNHPRLVKQFEVPRRLTSGRPRTY